MKYLPCFLLACILSSCVDEKDYKLTSLDVNPSISFPLAHGSVSIKDFLSTTDSSYVKTGTDGLISLVYSKNLLSQDIRGLFSIPTSNSTNTFSIPAATYPTVPQDIVLATFIANIDLGVSIAQLNEISFKSGQITLSTSINPNSNLNYSILVDIPAFTTKTNNQALSIQGKGPASIQLSNYIGKIDKNKFVANISVILKASTTPVTIAPNTKVTAQLAFTGMDFVYIKGFFGDQTTTIPNSTLNIGAYGTSLNKANLSLANPIISLDISNDYGIPLTITYNVFEARKSGAAALPVTINPANPVLLNTPTVLGTSAVTSIAVVNTNQVINYAPTQFYYQATARINKGLTSGNNFLADTSKMRVKLNVNMPLYGKASGIVLADTAALDLGDVNQSQITEAALRIKIANEIPLDGSVQFYLTDSKYVFLDSLLTTAQASFIKGSSVTSNGDLQTAGVSDQNLTISKDKLNKIFTAKYVVIKALLSTSKDASGNSVNVKFKSQYKMTIDAGVSAKLNFNVKL